MAKSDDLVKYITQRVTQRMVHYFDTPREIRKQIRLEKKHQVKEPWSVRWFGLMPMAFRVMFGGKSKGSDKGRE